jgi:hypothetical protein
VYARMYTEVRAADEMRYKAGVGSLSPVWILAR